MRAQRNDHKHLSSALHQRASFDQASRVEWLKVVLSLAFLLGLSFSSKLWVSNRAYPLTPIAGWLPAVPSPFDYILLASLFVTLVVIAVSPKPRKFMIALIVLVGFLSLWDQSRLQPWCYQYLVMFVVLGSYSWKKDDIEQQRLCLNVCRFIVASIYIWSGLQKVNANFLLIDFQWLMAPFLKVFPDTSPVLLQSLGMAVPVVEIAMGVSLFTKRFKQAAVILALTTHALILLALMLQGYNSVVWPWNVAMAAFVVILFWRTEGLDLKQVIVARNKLISQAVVVLFGIMPAFSFINLWDSYLSFTLYSGNLTHATLHMPDSVKVRLPAASQQYCIKQDDKIILDLSRWSFAELNVPAYPEWRIYRNIARQMCAYAENPSGMVLTVYEKPSWLSGKREMKSYDCAGFAAAPIQSASSEAPKLDLKSAP